MPIEGEIILIALRQEGLLTVCATTSLVGFCIGLYKIEKAGSVPLLFLHCRCNVIGCHCCDLRV